MNKKAQGLFTGFMVFAFIVIGLLVISPFLLKFFNSVVPAFSHALNNTSPEASAAVNYVSQTTIGWWDSVVLFLFFILLILLIVSSFLIDVHPFFTVFYIIMGIFFFAFAPATSNVLYKIYESPQFALEVSQTPALEFMVQYFWGIILGIYIFTGLIIFVKVRYFPSGGGR